MATPTTWLYALPTTTLLLLLVHVARNLMRIQHTQQQSLTRRNHSRRSPNTNDDNREVLLASSFHCPLYALTGGMLLLRVAMYLLLAAGTFAAPSSSIDSHQQQQWRMVTFYWLLELPSALLVALVCYLVLFFTSVTHARRWVTRTAHSWVAVVYAALCLLLLLLTLLVAMLRCSFLQLDLFEQRRHRRSGIAPSSFRSNSQRLTAAHATYAALMWLVLALLLLQSSATSVQLLWRLHRRRDPRRVRLSASALRALTRSSVSIALLLFARTALSLRVLPAVSTAADRSIDALLTQLLVQSVGWEVAVAAAVAYVLQRIPFVINDSAVIDRRRANVTFVLRVPTLRPVVSDVVRVLRNRDRRDGDDSSSSRCDNCTERALFACACDTSSSRSLHQALLADSNSHVNYRYEHRINDSDSDDSDTTTLFVG